MKRLRLFLSNFIVYGLGGIIGKIISFVMLPIVASLMPDTTYYGIYDMTTVLIAFGGYLGLMGMYDAMFRMYFEREDIEYKKNVCSTTLAYVLITTVIVSGVLIIAAKPVASALLGDEKYSVLVCLCAYSIATNCIYSIMCAPTRMNNQRIRYLVLNIINPVICYAIAIPLLLNGYYFIAVPLGSLIGILCVTIVFVIWNYKWFLPIRWDGKLIKEMLAIALPLLPNFLLYWVYSSTDRIMLRNILGMYDTGIYAIGAKVGQISQLIYVAFAGGWQYFAFSTMRDQDQVQLNSRIYEYLGAISFIATFGVAAIGKPLFEFFFEKPYADGYQVIPYLFLSPLLLMLFQVIVNQFLVIKKTWPNAMILAVGAIINVILNAVLIPQIGIEGAGIATLAGYMVALVIASVVLVRMKLLKISRHFLVASMILLLYIGMWYKGIYNRVWLNVVACVIGAGVILLLYSKDIRRCIQK